MALATAAFCAGSFALRLQTQRHSGSTANPLAPRVGKKIFGSSCAGCHGLDGRGGERAPNIVQNRAVQRLSDAQLRRIVREGVPGSGMPAFRSLRDPDVRALVAYLRTLQGTTKAGNLPGNPERGENLFFGKAGCSGCHMVAGKGGFIASDLSSFGQTHSLEQTRAAIVKPNQTGDKPAQTATVTTLDGEKYVGRIRNEDNFSLQLQTLDGAFHFFQKSDLERTEYSSQPLMPSDYGSTLSAGELNDIVSYLMKSAASGKSEKGGEGVPEHPEYED